MIVSTLPRPQRCQMFRTRTHTHATVDSAPGVAELRRNVLIRVYSVFIHIHACVCVHAQIAAKSQSSLTCESECRKMPAAAAAASERTCTHAYIHTYAGICMFAVRRSALLLLLLG